jgi:cell division protein FtsB
MPEHKQESNDTIAALSRRYQELLEERQQARQEIAKLRTELADEERRRGFLYVRRRALFLGGGSRLHHPST